MPRLSANPPWRLRLLRADDEARTRDLNLGKVVLYQLSYVRLLRRSPGGAKETIAEVGTRTNSGHIVRAVRREAPVRTG